MSEITLSEAIEGMKAGRTLVVDRRDCPILPDLLRMADAGEVETEFVQYDEQSSAMKFRWSDDS